MESRINKIDVEHKSGRKILLNNAYFSYEEEEKREKSIHKETQSFQRRKRAIVNQMLSLAARKNINFEDFED